MKIQIVDLLMTWNLYHSKHGMSHDIAGSFFEDFYFVCWTFFLKRNKFFERFGKNPSDVKLEVYVECLILFLLQFHMKCSNINKPGK